MISLVFSLPGGTNPIFLTKKKERWHVKACFKDGTLVDRRNLTDGAMWGLVKQNFDPSFKQPRDKKQLGIEWAALRMHKGSRPLIVPLARGGTWLYVERKGEEEYEVRIVEPLGTKRTLPKKITKQAAIQIVEQVSKRKPSP